VADKYKVKLSSVHGKGIFAKTKIKKGEKIGRYKGKVISWDEAQERFVDLDGHSHTFFFGINDEQVIDGDDNGNGMKYCNHSCTPNAEARNKKGKIWIHALQEIKKGGEIFYDYKLDYPEKITKKVLKKYACFCGTPGCRGTQLDLDQK
jgi:uncharacterized protein